MTESYRPIPEDVITPAPIKQVVPVNENYPTATQLSSKERFGGQEDNDVVVVDGSVEVRYSGGIVVSFPVEDSVITPGHRFEPQPTLGLRDYPGEIIAPAVLMGAGAVAAVAGTESSNGPLQYTGLSVLVIATLGLINQLTHRSFR